MLRMIPAVVVSGALGLYGAFLILTNGYPDEGPWVPISRTHGIHIGDVMLMGIWALITAGLLLWARAGRRDLSR